MRAACAIGPRHGDNYLHLAFALDVDLDELRDQNALWRLQVVPAGNVVTHSRSTGRAAHIVHLVRPGETLEQIAEELKATPWGIIHDNALWDEEVSEGMVLRRAAGTSPADVLHTPRDRR